jgi:hypothetical protein
MVIHVPQEGGSVNTACNSQQGGLPAKIGVGAGSGGDQCKFIFVDLIDQ